MKVEKKIIIYRWNYDKRTLHRRSSTYRQHISSSRIPSAWPRATAEGSQLYVNSDKTEIMCFEEVASI